jgi:hypothetical protein
MAFDLFKGYTPDVAPSIYDVQKRQALAKLLNDTQVQNQGPLGALANIVNAGNSAYQSQYAADEGQAGLSAANKKLGELLSGSSVNDVNPGNLITAGGDPFLPDSETGLVGDLIKRKLGIGETFYGTPQISYDEVNDPNHQHPIMSVIGSLGTVKRIDPPVGSNFSIKTQLVDTPTAAGVAINPYTGDQVTPGVNKDNAQAGLDRTYGETLGPILANAPETLQKEGNLLKTFTDQSALASNSVDQALNKVDDTWMTGLAGGLASAVPGTPQYDLAQTLLTIKSNITLGTLAQMKANAPNGASGLGSVSNFEDELLSAVNGSLDQKQSAGQLKANLQRIKTLMDQLVKDRVSAFAQDSKRLGTAPPTPPKIGSGSVTPQASGKVLTYNPQSGELE